MVYSTVLNSDEPSYDANNPIVRGGQPVEEHEYLTDALTREAVDFIDRNKDRPFFLYLARRDDCECSDSEPSPDCWRQSAAFSDRRRRIAATR
jgi:arylsulfatase B